MFNIGGGELIVILLIALIVLGPQRLPDAARQLGKAMGDLRRLSTGFQNEMKQALETADDPTRIAARRNVLAKEEPSTEPPGDDLAAVDDTAPTPGPHRAPRRRAPARPATAPPRRRPLPRGRQQEATRRRRRRRSRRRPRRPPRERHRGEEGNDDRPRPRSRPLHPPVVAAHRDLMSTAAVPPGLDDARMSLIEHLAELRDRLIKIVIALVIGMLIAFVLYDPIFDFLIAPYEDIANDDHVDDRGLRSSPIDPLEGFGIRMKLALYGGIAIAMPVILWQIWRFVTPGLYAHEKRYAIPFMVSALTLFVLGAGPRVLHAPAGARRS